MKRNAGSLIELLVALSVTSIGVVGMFSLYGYAQGLVHNQRVTAVAAQLARADLEKAKLLGFDNLPIGTVDGSKTKGTWNGPIEHYDANGASTTSANSFYKLQRRIDDRGISLGSGGTYTLNDTSMRSVRVTVWRTRDDSEMVTMGTNLIKGGL